MTNQTASEPRFTGKHMAAVLVLFFGTIVTVNMTLAVLANKTWSGLVVKNSYVASQHYNEKLAGARAQEALGWSQEIAYADGTLRFKLIDASGSPVEAENVTVKFMRPANEAFDATFAMQKAGAGVYTVTEPLGAGQWSVEVLADTGLDLPYRYRKRFVIPEGIANK